MQGEKESTLFEILELRKLKETNEKVMDEMNVLVHTLNSTNRGLEAQRNAETEKTLKV